MERRDFLKILVQGILVLLSTLAAVTAAIFAYPARIRQKTVQFIDVSSEDELPGRGIKRVVYEESGRKSIVYLAREGDSYVAFSPVCTHLGCLVSYNRSQNRFLCPCHGGKYDASGRVIEGPPPLPLTRLPMKVEKGRVFVGFKV
ncbi:MAG: ubiquinol-cytochrome c reductase iron-sulfur subunit [Nitrospirae bacterium]|nr:ubiquinol-cytochrome c reductase iron-sulfur subunit [Nitrospirota bacterium]